MRISIARRRVVSLLFLILGVLVASPASAWQEGDKLHLQLGAYTHYSHSDDHEGPPYLGNIELNKTNNWLFGLSLFNNSFGQFSQYIYFGKKWQLPSIYEHLHVKLSGGVVHGYTGEAEDKIPFNNNGIAPGIIPMIGVKKDRWALDLIFLGNSALLLAVGYDIIK